MKLTNKEREQVEKNIAYALAWLVIIAGLILAGFKTNV